MAYDAELAARVRRLLGRSKSVLTEKSMMGGIIFRINGNMSCGVDKKGLIVRVGPQRYEAALAAPEAGPMDITGKPLRGFVIVGLTACKSESVLQHWVRQGADFATSLPRKTLRAKKGKPSSKRRSK